jgi:hypothetical protein
MRQNGDRLHIGVAAERAGVGFATHLGARDLFIGCGYLIGMLAGRRLGLGSLSLGGIGSTIGYSVGYSIGSSVSRNGVATVVTAGARHESGQTESEDHKHDQQFFHGLLLENELIGVSSFSI